MSPMLPLITVLSIPSPSQGTWEIGPVPLRAYALCIIAGIMVAIWIGERRWVARGGVSSRLAHPGLRLERVQQFHLASAAGAFGLGRLQRCGLGRGAAAEDLMDALVALLCGGT